MARALAWMALVAAGAIHGRSGEDETRRAQAEFRELISSASRGDLRRRTNGTRWTNTTP
jgi:hypothetical protein